MPKKRKENPRPKDPTVEWCWRYLISALEDLGAHRYHLSQSTVTAYLGFADNRLGYLRISDHMRSLREWPCRWNLLLDGSWGLEERRKYYEEGHIAMFYYVYSPDRIDELASRIRQEKRRINRNAILGAIGGRNGTSPLKLKQA